MSGDSGRGLSGAGRVSGFFSKQEILRGKIPRKACFSTLILFQIIPIQVAQMKRFCCFVLPLILELVFLQGPAYSADESVLVLPEVFFASSPLKVRLKNPTGSEAGTAVLAVYRHGGRSPVLSGIAFDSTGAAGAIIPSSGRYRLSVTVGERVIDRTIRVLPGFLTTLPPVAAIILALVFRQVIVALFVGVWFGASLLAGLNPLTGMARLVDTYLIEAVTNVDQVRIIIFCMTLGGMVGMITRSGGAAGLIRLFSRFAVNRKMTQLSTWLMGLLIFFDDYSNVLMVGNTMRPFSDKMKVSREKLSFIVDSTAAPIASVAFISTWIGFELGMLSTCIKDLGLSHNAYWLFLKSLPFSFYNWACLSFVLMLVLSGRDFGPMWKAENRAATTGEVIAPGAQPLVDNEMSSLQAGINAPPRWYNAIVPIVTMSIVLVVGLYKSGSAVLEGSDTPRTIYNIIGSADPFQALLWASFGGVFASFALIMVQRILSVREAMDSFLIGFKSLALAMIILTLARVIQLICAELGTANYLLNISRGYLSAGMLPALTFVLSAVTSFSTGTSWGTMAILMPLIVPLSYHLPVDAGLAAHQVELTMLGAFGAVLSGAVFGDHCSPISDTTIMSSMSSGADHVDHVKTQLPYAVTVALACTLLGYLPVGLGLVHPLFSNVIIIAVLFVVIRLFGRKHVPDNHAEPVEGAPGNVGP